MKKIFITIPWFYPAFKAGGPVQSIVNMVNELNEGFEFYVFTSNNDLNREVLTGITTKQWIQFNSYTKVWYAADKKNRDLFQQIKKIKPHILYVVGLFDFYFNIIPLFFCKVQKKILSVRGMLHPGALTQKKLKKKLFLNFFKVLSANRDFFFHATDTREEENIKERLGNNHAIHVAGNFPRVFNKKGYHQKKKGSLHLITIALISPMKNHLLTLKSIAESKAFVRYDIYGPVKDEAYWESCLEQIAKLPSNIQVTYHGEIQPDNVPDILSSAEVFIMPSKSENYGHSIVEALTAGLPVISSYYTPWNDLKENSAGINVSVDCKEILAAVEFFVNMDEEIYNEWTISAVEYIKSRTSPAKLKSAYQALFS